MVKQERILKFATLNVNYVLVNSLSNGVRYVDTAVLINCSFLAWE